METTTTPSITSAYPVTRTGAPIPGSSTLTHLAPTSRTLARLQITLPQQPHLNQLERYIESQAQVIKDITEKNQTQKEKSQASQTKTTSDDTNVLSKSPQPQI